MLFTHVEGKQDLEQVLGICRYTFNVHSLQGADAVFITGVLQKLDVLMMHTSQYKLLSELHLKSEYIVPTWSVPPAWGIV